MTRVLIVDDDPVQLRLTTEAAARGGFAPVPASGGTAALELLRADPLIGAMVLDLVMPDLDGMGVLDAMAREGLAVPVIVQTAHSSLDAVVSAMRHGAIDFFVKPVAPERLVVSLRNAVRLGTLEAALRLDRVRADRSLTLADLASRSPAMDRVRLQAAKAARSALPILVEGEPGTGKQTLARAIHGSGERAGRPFLVLNCPAAPTAAELAARLAEAQGGTLFLREVGELTAEAQQLLARALETGELPAAGGRAQKFGVRVMAGSSRRLLNLARAGLVREDLYYRLNVFPLYLPPLRDRREDIAPLAERAATRFAAELGRRVAGLSGPALALLEGFGWPGNLRQLEAAIYRALAIGDGAYLERADFPQIVALGEGRAEAIRLNADLPAPSAPVHIDDAMLPRREETRPPAAPDRFLAGDGEVAALAEVERALIAFALDRYGHRMSRVARVLGIGRSTLYRKLREYGLDEGYQSDAA